MNEESKTQGDVSIAGDVQRDVNVAGGDIVATKNVVQAPFPTSLNFAATVKASFVAGVISGILSGLPLLYLGNCCLCMWHWTGGIYGVWLYRQYEGEISRVDSLHGAIVGGIAGLIASVVGLLTNFVVGSINLEMFQIWGDLGPGGGLAMAGLSSVMIFVFAIFFYPLFGAIGGVIGAQVIPEREFLSKT